MQAEQIPAPPALPAPPAPPTGARVVVPGGADLTVVGAGQELAVPRTQAEVRALRSRGEMLSDQLTSAQGRRDNIAEELSELPPGETAVRAGLEQRLAQLDGRILRIEQDIAENGRLLAAAPPSMLANSEVGGSDEPFALSSGQITAISLASVVFVAMPIAVGATVMMLRRSSRPHVPAVPAATQQRLERMEQAVDTIAIEMERVSESQRFLTRILTEGPAKPIAIDGGAPQAVPVSRGEAVPASRGEP